MGHLKSIAQCFWQLNNTLQLQNWDDILNFFVQLLIFLLFFSTLVLRADFLNQINVNVSSITPELDAFL